MQLSVPGCLLSLFLCISLSGYSCSDKHYLLAGRVVSKVPATRTIVVDHSEIPHFMAAMTMPYPVAQGEDLGKIEPGDRIKARIVVRPDQQYWLDKISVTDSSHRETVVKEAKQLYPGETIPDVELLNQDGKRLRLSDFRGKTVLLTFIYTRCPMPTFCPRMSSLFAAVDRELARNSTVYEHTHLVSVSIDPKNQRKRRLLGETKNARIGPQVAIGMALLGFTSFYREGFEVILFLQSYRLRLGAAAVLQGVIVGVVATAMVAILTFVAHRHLPYRKMLVATGVMLACVLIVMVGEQAQEMQLAGWLPTTEIPRLAQIIPSWAGLWLSLFPTVETFSSQILAGLLVFGCYVAAQPSKRTQPAKLHSLVAQTRSKE
jgi:Cu/Ag efflux protein CusF